MDKLNFIVIMVSIIGVILGTFTQIGVYAQGTINQSMNASSIEGEDTTITEGPGGVSSQETLEAAEAPPICGSQDVGCVRVDTSCILEDRVSCDPIVEKLFNIFPFEVRNNQFELNNSPFPASELGRNVTFFTGFNASVEYDIREETQDFKLFHGFKNYSSDCRGVIKAGETKLCTIENSLYFEPLGPRPGF